MESLEEMERHVALMGTIRHKFIPDLGEIPPACATCGLGEGSKVHDQYRGEGKAK